MLPRLVRTRNGSVLAAVFIISLLMAGACGDQAGTEVKARGVPQQGPRPAEVTAASTASTGFAADLYRQLSTRSGNLAFSPFAVALGLGMSRSGAKGDTWTQLTRVLHAEGVDDLDAGLGSTSILLTGQTGERQSDVRKGRIDLTIASGLWGQQGTRFDPTFLDGLARSYGEGMHVIDFRSDPETARKAINSWAEHETAGATTELIPRGTITQLTRLVLASTLALEAPWLVNFPTDNTRMSPFRLLDGQAVDAPTMGVRERDAFLYSRGTDCQAVSIPYLGGELSMVVIVPDEGRFDSFEGDLDGPTIEGIVRALSPVPLDLRLPQFQFTTNVNLNQPLAQAGMPVAFSRDDADFTGITDDAALAISDVTHQVYVAVDEQGTDGAATTVVSTSTPAAFTATTLAVDRPFVFLVRDDRTGMPLIIGRVVNPLE